MGRKETAESEALGRPPPLFSHRSDFVLTSLFSPRRDAGQLCVLPVDGSIDRSVIGQEKKTSFRQRKG